MLSEKQDTLHSVKCSGNVCVGGGGEDDGISKIRQTILRSTLYPRGKGPPVSIG
jgi:hypothetical protein